MFKTAVITFKVNHSGKPVTSNSCMYMLLNYSLPALRYQFCSSLLHYCEILTFRTSKFGENEVKLQCSTEGGKNDFWFGFWEIRRIKDSRNLDATIL